MARIRQIAYDQTFLDQAALLQTDAKRLDELLVGVLWLIATHAEDCEVVERNLRVAFYRSLSRRASDAHLLHDNG